MAIVQLNRLTVYGTSCQKEAALEGLQSLGCLHLISLRESDSRTPELVSKEAREALRYLQACSARRPIKPDLGRYSQPLLIEQVLAIKQESERLVAERDGLEKAIKDLQPWGEFSLPPTADGDPHQFWFHVIPLNHFQDLDPDLRWFVANKDNRYAYVVVLANQPPAALSTCAVDLDPRSLSELRSRSQRVHEKLEELHWQRVGLTRWRELLKKDLDAADDKSAQLAAAKGVLDDDTVFALQGWVPRVAIGEVKLFAQKNLLAITIEPVGANDAAPTLLKNPERVAGAEGCVTFYITPGYHAWDPTTIVYFSFSLFFAMIVADAGYGLVMAGVLGVMWQRLSRTHSERRIRNFLTGVVTATILYGVIVGSFFGLEPPSGTLLDSLRVRIDGQPMMKNQSAMMMIAVAIGVGHLVIANTISAWQSRSSSRALGHLGWALMILGAFLFGIGSMSDIETSRLIGEVLVGIGALGVLGFSSDRVASKGRIKSSALRLIDGAMQFTSLSKAFGDVLSYLRLFALGLASSQLAVTFNGLAGDASERGGIGLLMALVILIVGHSINFVLGLLSGVVHGLRLNCIEFFNWSLTEEGYTFQPFRKKSETQWIHSD